MRELTFQGFLQKYVRSLSEQDTLSIYKLAREATAKNPRLREPLLLYALFSNKTDVLLRATKDKKLHKEYTNTLSNLNKQQMMGALKSQCGDLDTNYLKVWKSYLSQKNRAETDNQTKALMRTKIVKLQMEKQVTNYRLYKDLNLNPGNLNAYLKHSECGKLSLDTSRKVMHYLENR